MPSLLHPVRGFRCSAYTSCCGILAGAASSADHTPSPPFIRADTARESGRGDRSKLGGAERSENCKISLRLTHADLCRAPQ